MELISCVILKHTLEGGKNGKELAGCNGSLLPSLLQSLPDPDAAAESWPAAAAAPGM